MAERNAGMKAAMLMCGLIVVGLILTMSAAGVAATPTPTHNATTPTPVPTPVPTPAPREVFSTVSWDEDRAYVVVTNNGPAIDVEACIGSLSNKTTTHVPANTTTRVPTASLSASPGQVIHCWFKAYENGTLISSMDNVPVTVTTSATATPPPEAGVVTGTIVDAATGNPINGAEVIFASETYDKQYPSVYTDASGTFVTGKMYLDSYAVTVKASGYQTMTGMRVERLVSGTQKLTDGIKLTPISIASPTPTPTPTPSATPGSPFDAWMSLLYSPQACCGTLAVALGAIVSATAIYEWTMRQRERRKQKEAKDKAEGKAPESGKESK